MAITKLMNLKESRAGNAGRHLKNCINYIMNEEKTIGGSLIGGNVSILNPDESYDSFIETKTDYGKLEGRQGYHFVVSFSPGELGYEEAYDVIQEWADMFLGDDYDYVFSVHTDHDHIHGHIVFNSVRRTDGRKYHYHKGDWSAYIQPITDQICIAHGLEPLDFDERGKGQSYADWMNKKEKGFTEKDIYRADIDYLIRQSDSYDEFKKALRAMGYTIQREGYSRKTEQEYLTLKAPGLSRGRRTDKLGPAYSLAAIKERIRTKEGPEADKRLSGQMQLQFRDLYFNANDYTKSTSLYRRVSEITGYYEIRTIYAKTDWKIRKDILELNHYIDALTFVNRERIGSEKDLHTNIDLIVSDCTAIRSERYSLIHLKTGMTDEEKAIADKYCELKRQEEHLFDDRSDSWEAVADELEQIENEYSYNIYSVTDRIERLSEQLKAANMEKKYLDLILDAEAERSEEETVPEFQPEF